MTAARIAALEPPFSPPVAEALERIMPKDVPPLALFRTLAVNERVFLRVMASGLLDRGSLSLRERELVIDRTCARCGSEYEWGVHVAFFAERVKLTPAEIAATRAADPETTPFATRERLLLRLVDELHDTAQVSDGLWQALRGGQHPTLQRPQAESSVRPLARRAERMARPARVRIRRRKPWVFARRRLFGW